MQFSTPVNTDSGGFRLGLDQEVMMLGSCFVENIGKKLVENKFHVLLNPFGVLYNPMSIIQSLDRVARHCLRPCPLTEEDIFNDGQMWYSWLFSTEYTAPTPAELLKKLNATLDAAAEVLSRLDVLFITFGTNRYYRLKSSGLIVANCHKQPQRLFSEEQSGVGDIVRAWQHVARRLYVLRPALKVVFSVSPYRYIKYGLHQSRVGKAVLLLAVEQISDAVRTRSDVLKTTSETSRSKGKFMRSITESASSVSAPLNNAPNNLQTTSESFQKTSESFQKTSESFQKTSELFSTTPEGDFPTSRRGINASDLQASVSHSEQAATEMAALKYYYFPAYEVMNDELRDYRFYAPDMVHPSAQAVDYLWEIFLRDWASDDARAFVRQWQSVLSGLNHRPFLPESETYRKFLLNLKQKMRSLREKYPNLALRNEERILSQRLSEIQDGHDEAAGADSEPFVTD